MRIFWHELRMSWLVAFWVNLGTSLLILVGILKYTGFAADATASQALIAAFPQVVLAVLGMSSLDLTTLAGFYGVLYFYIFLIGALYAISLGVNCFAREENEQTIEFILTKPIARWQLFALKFATAVFWLVVYIGVSALVSVIGIQLIDVSETLTNEIWFASAGLFVTLLTYLALGAWSATYFAKATTGGLLAYSLFAVHWMMSIFYLSFENGAWLRLWSPFTWYPTAQLLAGTWSWSASVIAVLVIGSLLAVSVWRFTKMDVRLHA